MLTFLLLLSALSHAKSAAPAKKAALLAEMEKSCVQSSFVDGKNESAVCGCLKENYDRYFDEPKLEALRRVHLGTLPKEEHEKFEDVFEFDMLASQKCIEDINWRWVSEKPKATPEKPAAGTEKPAKKAAAPKKKEKKQAK